MSYKDKSMIYLEKFYLLSDDDEWNFFHYQSKGCQSSVAIASLNNEQPLVRSLHRKEKMDCFADA